MVEDRNPSPDIVIIGSGMGGGTIALGLADSGARITLIERGEFVPQEPENWSVGAVFIGERYKAREHWQTADGSWFQPAIHYAVGGNTKVYGAALPRYRPSDFEAVEHAEGISPAWPFRYEDLAPFYGEAERIFGVHGTVEAGQEQARIETSPFPPVEHEEPIVELARRLVAEGYTASHLPLGIDLRPHGGCIRCSTCDGFVCRLHAKADADIRCVRPALMHDGVSLLTGSHVTRILTDRTGSRATGVEISSASGTRMIAAGTVIVSCGAANSAALLLRSRNAQHSRGLANRSGVVGRHYMIHNNTAMLSARPFRRNRAVFPKTLYVNDFYERGVAEHPYPLGHIQLVGKLQEPMTRSVAPLVPRWMHRHVTGRSIDWRLYSEDLPDPKNRVELTDGDRLRISWTPNNLRSHELLTREARRMARSAGFPITLTRHAGVEDCGHQAGTVRAGGDPEVSALDANCRAHDIENLYVVDSSFFPSLPAMNPGLTIAANALRVAAHLRERR
jgi:choline dehydrogenase-like flavoprotein